MNKVKSPFVKVLRKAGFSTKEAMNITLDAQFNYHQQHNYIFDRTLFNRMAVSGAVAAMFDWSCTDEGHTYWDSIWAKLGYKFY